jgi:hypothetical protein
MSELPHSCEACGDDGTLYLSPKCHPVRPVFAALTGDVLSMECAQCRQVVCRMRVVEMIPETEAAQTEEHP